MSPALIFASLPGHWALTRTISGVGSMSGQALFSAITPNSLTCRESGQLTQASGESSEVFRAYTYELDGDDLLIFYNDPTRQDLMHRLRLVSQDGGFKAQDCHVCGEDRYELDWTWHPDGPRLELHYKVSGPRKDYSITTTLIRTT